MKEQIQNKATELFLQQGFKSVTMDDIADEIGISKKTIYAHYSTKSKLIEACVSLLIEEIKLGIESLKAENLNPVIENFKVKVYVQRMLKNEKTSPQYQLKKYYPKIYNKIRNTKFNITQRYGIDNLQRGITTGDYRANMQISFVSRIHFAGLLAIKDKALFSEDEYSNNKLMDYLLEYHLRAICTPKGLATLEAFLKDNKKNNEV